jgi:hypothetical protein
MAFDERGLRELVDESQDLHHDALRDQRSVLEDLADVRADVRAEHSAETRDPGEVAQFNEKREQLADELGLSPGGWARTGVLAGGIGAALAALIMSPASADTDLDVQMLQTASSLEILAVATYEAALGLPIISGGNPVIVAFAETTKMQHDEHRQAFQAQTKALGGQEQTAPNAKYAAVVEQAKPLITAPVQVVRLAATLEQVATETYLADLAQFSNRKSKEIMASVMGVETQHLATLRAVDALLTANAPELVAIPVDAAALPAAAGSVAFPVAFQGTTMASPPQEGALS